jgi:ankyrin repeat protein
MNTNNFLGRRFHSNISHLAAMALIALACRIPAFCGEIHNAAKKGDLAKVKELLKDHPELVSSRDNVSETPLYWATANGYKSMKEHERIGR